MHFNVSLMRMPVYPNLQGVLSIFPAQSESVKVWRANFKFSSHPRINSIQLQERGFLLKRENCG